MSPGQYIDPEMTPAQVIQWPQFQAMFAKAHKRGEHIAGVGTNGSGKTALLLELCKIIAARTATDKLPERVVVLQYKPRDDTLRKILPTEEWPIIKKWPPNFGQEHCIVWPRGFPPSRAAKEQQAVFVPLLDTIYQEGNQTVYIPEAAYFERPLPNGLGMTGTMEQFWSTARSLEITTISDTQRPRRVTLLMWTEPKWFIIFHTRNHDDLKHIADLSGFKREVWDIVPKLGEHEFLCIRAQSHGGKMALYISKLDM